MKVYTFTMNGSIGRFKVVADGLRSAINAAEKHVLDRTSPYYEFEDKVLSIEVDEKIDVVA